MGSSFDPVGASATYSVIQLDDDAHAALIVDARAGNFVLTLPDDLVVSHQERVARAW